jgi:hypothetical protein
MGKNQADFAFTLLLVGFLIGILFDPEHRSSTFLRNVYGLYSAVSQKIVVFIVTAVRTSDVR